ncbi:hypothetical protein FACS1894184_20730 [Clostridia bacterium]|nr:hypothetical protein FACS1894184_20730 [Clostridia bacterium]
MPESIELWHPGFVWVVIAELFGYRGLEFIREYKLTAESLRVDVVVVKKTSNELIDKNFARIFRGHNLIEYKSPTDGFDVHDLMKTLSYVFLYLYSTEASIHDITLSIVLSRHPVSMINFLKDDLGVALKNTESGIYKGEILGIPLQVIENHKLDSKTNLWLHSYTSNASTEDVKAVIETYPQIEDTGQLTNDDLSGLLASYLRTMMEANPSTFKEVLNNMFTAEAKKIIGEIKVVQEMSAEAVEESRIESYKLLVRNGLPLEKLADYGVDAATISRVSAPSPA